MISVSTSGPSVSALRYAFNGSASAVKYADAFATYATKFFSDAAYGSKSADDHDESKWPNASYELSRPNATDAATDTNAAHESPRIWSSKLCTAAATSARNVLKCLSTSPSTKLPKVRTITTSTEIVEIRTRL